MISVKIIADSISVHGDRITTWELIYNRYIHSELLTHRLFSRNSASSRAIPIDKMIELVREHPAAPIHWGLNQAGMQAKTEHKLISTCMHSWRLAGKAAIIAAERLQGLGLHKQIVNRVLEPYQWMKTIVTATEYNNWYALRDHSDAQPEIARIAELMKIEIGLSKPQVLEVNEWHLPYVTVKRNLFNGKLVYSINSGEKVLVKDEIITLEEALKISASCCAQVSYRLLDESLEKALKIYDALVNQRPVHASPFEHQARVMNYTNCNLVGYAGRVEMWDKGVTHMDRNYNLWSGNFKGWIQNRQLIKDNVVEG